MSDVSWGKHALILGALILNLWIGGDYVELWLGRGARGVFEISLILGYLTLIVGLHVPLPWRRRGKDDAPRPPAGGDPGLDRDHDPTRSL